MMQPEAIREAVEQLMAARRDMRLLPGLPARCRPETPDDAYAIQEAFVRAWGGEVAGWKVGATSPEALRTLNLEGPFYGPVFSPLVMRSPAEPAAAKYNMRAVECEFAFRLGEDLPARGRPYGRQEVERAVQAVIPAIELVDTRYDSFAGYGGIALIADCGGNGGLVLGDEFPDWRAIDLAEQAVTLDVAGERKAEGSGKIPLGHPLEPLFWFVNARTERGAGLRTGEVISTGTCTGLSLIAPDQTAIADFGQLGQIQVRFIP